MKYRRFLLLLVSVCLMNACGFKLRGAMDLSQDMSPIYLQQNSVFELGREIKLLLTANKIQITENEKQAMSHLTLLSEVKSRRVLSVDSNGRVREYLLNYTVNYSIERKQAENNEGVESSSRQGSDAHDPVSRDSISHDSISHDSVSHDSVSVARSLLYDPDAVIAVVNESEILYKDMRRDAARLVLLKLQAGSRQKTRAEDAGENNGAGNNKTR